MVIKHATIKIAGQTLAAVADWNADHSGTATPEVHGNAAHSSVFITAAEVSANETDPIYSAWIAGPPNVSEFTNDAGYLIAEADPVFTAWDKDHADLSNVTTDQHHAKQHVITAAADHTSTATPAQMLKADANGLPVDATNTDAQVSGAVTASHAAVTLHASATTGGLSLAAQEISNRAATNAQTGYATAAHITAIEANTLKDTNVTTDLSAGARTATTIKVDSSDGTDATLVEADTTNAGILGSDKWDEIVANSLKETNVTTNLSMGAIDGTTMVITCSDGTDVTLIAADTDDAGLLTAAKFDEIEANNLKETNVTTDLSAGARTATTIKVDSSDGTDATLVEADTTNAGILGSDKWDEIVANTLASHAESHNIASHSDTTATGAELETLTDGSDSDGLHAHAVNDAKVSYIKTNVKGHVEHGAVAATARAAGFTSVEWVGSVEPTNAVNGDTWIDTT